MRRMDGTGHGLCGAGIIAHVIPIAIMLISGLIHIPIAIKREAITPIIIRIIGDHRDKCLIAVVSARRAIIRLGALGSDTGRTDVGMPGPMGGTLSGCGEA